MDKNLIYMQVSLLVLLFQCRIFLPAQETNPDRQTPDVGTDVCCSLLNYSFIMAAIIDI